MNTVDKEINKPGFCLFPIPTESKFNTTKYNFDQINFDTSRSEFFKNIDKNGQPVIDNSFDGDGCYWIVKNDITLDNFTPFDVMAKQPMQFRTIKPKIPLSRRLSLNYGVLIADLYPETKEKYLID